METSLKQYLAGILLALVSVAWVAEVLGADKLPVLLAIDAEFGVKASTSAQAIQHGAEIAAAEINEAGGVLDGRPLKIITRNNNSMPARATENLKELSADPALVAVMGGKHSPVVQQLLPLIHEIGIPYLVPWAAADDITSHSYRPNFVFRLSLKDSWALETMIRSAAARGHRRLGLLLPNSGWGRSSLKAAQRIVQSGAHKGLRLVSEQWYNFGDQDFVVAYDTLRRDKADALLLVANELEGAALVREIARHPRKDRIPVFSHWGVTGGQFFSLAREALAKVDFSVVQTYSFVDAQDARARQVLAAAAKYGITDRRALESPVGLAHAYDLTHLLALAINRAGRLDRGAIRTALENLPPYQGLVKHYQLPFTNQRHDGLDAAQVYMARYAADGAVIRAQ